MDRNESKVLADLLPTQLHELVDHGFEQAQRLELLPLILGGRMVGQELVDVEEEEVDVKQRKVGAHASSHLQQALERSLHKLGCKRTISEGRLGGSRAGPPSRALALLGPLG
jgi:hypothetical protein